MVFMTELFSLFVSLGKIGAACSTWEMTSGRSVLTQKRLLFGHLVGSLNMFTTLIFVGSCGRTLKILEAGRTIPFRIRLGFGDMYRSLGVLFVTNTDAAVFGKYCSAL